MQRNKQPYGQVTRPKKSSNISTVMYKDIGEALKGYSQRRSQKNSYGNITTDQTVDHNNNAERENSNSNVRDNGKIQKRRDSKASNNSRGKA